VRLYAKTGSHRLISLLGVIVCLGALGALIWQRAQTSPQELGVLGVMLALAFVIETVYRGITGRVIRAFIKGDITD
jgi:type IV secretory pathway TrbF-like protein